MKAKITLLLLSILALCQCVSDPSAKKMSEKDMSGITAELDTMVNRLLGEKQDLLDEKGELEADTITAQCYETALSEMAKKYGEESDENVACLQHVADNLYDVESPFSETCQLAYSCYDKALALCKKLYGEKSIAVGKCYTDMIYASGRDSHDAQQYADSALAILVPACGESSAEVAYVYRFLGDSYKEANHDIYRSAAQSMIMTQSDYYDAQSYQDLISNLEKSLSNYRKALELFTGVGDDQEVALLKEDLKNTEEELKENQEGLSNAKDITPEE